MIIHIDMEDYDLEVNEIELRIALNVCRHLDDGLITLKSDHKKDLLKVVAIRAILEPCELRLARDFTRYYKQEQAKKKQRDIELQAYIDSL